MNKRAIRIIVDCQYGSTGKGLIAGYLAERDKPDTLVTAWAANAGHTYIDRAGRKFVHTMLANGVVSPGLERVLLGPGSILNLDNLLAEIKSCHDLIIDNEIPIYCHANAAVITQQHRDEEEGPMTLIGSTKKGCGAAAIQRIRRNPNDMNTALQLLNNHPVSEFVRVVTPMEYATVLDDAQIVQVEGAQGFSLSMYHGFYPYTTSRDVSTAQILADCAIPFSGYGGLSVLGTCRTYPIRVANRFNSEGIQVGWSGPIYPDQEETTFESLSQPVELTTVTKLPRRIFTFSQQQVAEAVRMCGVNEIFLNFCNYIREEVEFNRINNMIEKSAPIVYEGWGPTANDINDYSNLYAKFQP